MPAAEASAVAAAAADSSAVDKAAKKRTRTGCLVCRKRKHKCPEDRVLVADGTYSCSKCIKLSQACLWPVEAPREARFAPYRARGSAQDAARQPPRFAPSFVPSAAAASSSSYSPSHPTATPLLNPQSPSPLFAPPPPHPLPLGIHSYTADGSSRSEWLRTPGGAQSMAHLPGQQGAFSPQQQQPASAQLLDWTPSPSAFVPALSFSPPSPWSLSDSGGPPARDNKGVRMEDDGRASSSAVTLPAELLQLLDQPVRHLQYQQQLAHGWSHDQSVEDALLPLYMGPTSPLIRHFFLIVPTLFSQTKLPLSRQHGHEPVDRASINVQTFFPFLDLPAFLATPRGSSSATEALALSLMSIGATHLQFLHSKGASDAGEQGGRQVSLANANKYDRLASSLVDSSLALGHTSLLLSQLAVGGSFSAAVSGNVGTNAVGSTREDLSHLLAACSASLLTCCFTGKTNHSGALNLAINVVQALGGPTAILAAEAKNASLLFPASTRRTSARKRIRIVRALLEDISAYELLLALTLDRPLKMVDPGASAAGGSPGDSHNWLIKYGPGGNAARNFGRNVPDASDDWETIIFTMGFSRRCFELAGRVGRLCFSDSPDAPSAAFAHDHMSEPPSRQRQAEDLVLECKIRAGDVLMVHPELTFDGRALDECEEEPPSAVEFSTLEWSIAMEIILRTEVLKESKTSIRLQTLALHVVNISAERARRGVDNLGSAWPLAIAASLLRAEVERQATRQLFASFSFPVGYDMSGHFLTLLEEVWAAQDAGDEETSWRTVPSARQGLILF